MVHGPWVSETARLQGHLMDHAIGRLVLLMLPRGHRHCDGTYCIPG